MADSERRSRYPWGTTTPRPRLRAVCAGVRVALDDAKSPGFGPHASRVTRVVQATVPLVEAMRHLSGAGLRPAATADAKPIDAADVRAAVDRVDGSVNDLAAASVFDLSERYRAFCDAVEALLTVADDSVRWGIARPPEARAGDGWAVFTS